jgi:NADPH-dependent 2,4-dienoyl-CoA reductase/sulfur reductase-like enzyme
MLTSPALTCIGPKRSSSADFDVGLGLPARPSGFTERLQILAEQLPSSIIIGGSGAIGVEFAYVLKNFGVDVTIVEFLDRMVPTEDADVSNELLRQYKKLGVNVLLSTAVKGAEDTGSGVKVRVAPAAGVAGEDCNQTADSDKDNSGEVGVAAPWADGATEAEHPSDPHTRWLALRPQCAGKS